MHTWYNSLGCQTGICLHCMLRASAKQMKVFPIHVPCWKKKSVCVSTLGQHQALLQRKPFMMTWQPQAWHYLSYHGHLVLKQNVQADMCFYLPLRQRLDRKKKRRKKRFTNLTLQKLMRAWLLTQLKPGVYDRALNSFSITQCHFVVQGATDRGKFPSVPEPKSNLSGLWHKKFEVAMVHLSFVKDPTNLHLYCHTRKAILIQKDNWC